MSGLRRILRVVQAEPNTILLFNWVKAGLKTTAAVRRCIADKAFARFKDRVRELTRRHRGVSLEKMIADLPFVRSWAGYFGFSQGHELPSLGGWIRRRLRCVAWVQ